MSQLSDRLREIVRPQTGTGTASPPHDLPRGVDRGELAVEDILERALGGRWTHSKHCFVVERRTEADEWYGDALVGDIAARIEDPARQNSLDLIGAPGARPFLFFDLETTGLSGGAGTFAFIVGVGWFDSGAFVARQHLLVDFDHESTMLEDVAADFSRAGTIVSFNGKSFDVPVLDTRCLLHRLDWSATTLPHLDVLHPARRFWTAHDEEAPLADSCSLVALEQRLLGVRRVGDVNGYEIPLRYFQFLRTGDARPLAPVLEHNRLDLLSLAVVTAHLVHLLREGAAVARNGWEALALGRMYLRAGLFADTRAACERALVLADESSEDAAADVIVEALRLAAVTLRRERRFDEAAGYWRRLLDADRCTPRLAREASEALAIHHEHRVRDLPAAKAFALKSLAEGLEGSRGVWRDGVRHRLERIDRKMSTAKPSRPSLPWLPSSGSPTSGRRTSS